MSSALWSYKGRLSRRFSLNWTRSVGYCFRLRNVNCVTRARIDGIINGESRLSARIEFGSRTAPFSSQVSRLTHNFQVMNSRQMRNLNMQRFRVVLLTGPRMTRHFWRLPWRLRNSKLRGGMNGLFGLWRAVYFDDGKSDIMTRLVRKCFYSPRQSVGHSLTKQVSSQWKWQIRWRQATFSSSFFSCKWEVVATGIVLGQEGSVFPSINEIQMRRSSTQRVQKPGRDPMNIHRI
jgi:hypothetical protein